MLKVIRITSVILLVYWMGLIFSLSAENSEESSRTSGQVISMIVKIFYPDFETLSKAAQKEFIAPFQFFARKGAHFTIYAILGAFAFCSVFTYSKLTPAVRLGISSGICLLYSVSDEIHQRFVPGRSGEIRDVLIDFCGSLLAIFILSLIVKHSKNKFIKKHFGGENYEKKTVTST